MRLNWFLDATYGINENGLREGSEAFFDKHGVVPETVKMAFRDMNRFMGMNAPAFTAVYLEKGKEYSHYIPIPGGMLELGILEADQEVNAIPPNITSSGLNATPVLVVFESNKVDREFEKHVLRDK